MSGEKTEKATPKRQREAREKGQIAKSAELNSAFVLLLIYLGINIFDKTMATDLKLVITSFLSEDYFNQPEFFGSNLQHAFILSVKYFLTICGPLFLIALLTGVVVNYMQVGFLFSPKLLAMKFDKINPLSGMKRIFSLRALVEMVKSILKMVLVGAVVYFELKKGFNQIPGLIYVEITQTVGIVWSALMNIMWKSGLTLLILGAFDYAYQKWEHEKNLKMSKEEIKQEYKMTEGDPKVKARIREVQRQMGMRRMMQQISKADVVITNPTHFAVVLKYDESKNSAPVVVAKGQDLVALRIKDEAKKHKVKIVEDKPLAQALYKTTKIDEAIPEDLYQAVAQILAMVYRTKIR